MPSWAYMLLWGVVFLLLMRFGCGSHVFGHGHRGHGGRHGEGPARGEGAQGTPPLKAVDPVCGKEIATRSAKTAVHQGDVYYFCSSTCRDRFESSPTTYTKPATGGHQHGEHQHG